MVTHQTVPSTTPRLTRLANAIVNKGSHDVRKGKTLRERAYDRLMQRRQRQRREALSLYALFCKLDKQK